MKSPRNNRAGFTLIELMMVIGIIGLLSAIAIPAFQQYAMQARTTERIVMTAHMAQNAITYIGTNDVAPPSSAPNPASVPSEEKRGWETRADWQWLDGVPAAQVYYRYWLNSNTGPVGGSFLIVAQGDLDGDNVRSRKVLYYRWHSGTVGWEPLDLPTLDTPPGIF